MDNMRVATARTLATAAALAAFVVYAAPVQAQTARFEGRMDITLTDATGAVLPGVAVEITGPRDASAVTDANGEARFLNLPPGVYEVRATLAGFNEYLNRNVHVVSGASVPLRITLRVAGLAEQVEVTAESPVIDPRRQATATNVTLDELQNVPSSRDPWVVLQTVPGIVVDRVNVGGSESGQQSNYFAKGAASQENTWSVDGIPITDMAALGASPTYYDFDMFQEMQVTTGGSEIQSPTAGVQLNMVLKSGTNRLRGSSRVYFSNESMQSSNLPDELAHLGGVHGKGNRTEQYSDYGVEVGGPLVRDRLWAWGSYGKTDVRILTLIDTSDRTILENSGFKLQGQANDSVRGNFTFFRGDKIKHGRDASPTRPDETTWNQDGPTSLYKGEANFVVGQNLFITGKGAYVDGGFQLIPKGGLEPNVVLGPTNVWSGSYLNAVFERPQYTAMGDGNYFLGRHEVKFGGYWRSSDSLTAYDWPGIGGYTRHLPDGRTLVFMLRPYRTDFQSVYTGAYASNTTTWDRLTLNVGVRLDHAVGHARETTQPANPTIPDLFPSITAPEVRNVRSHTMATPRVGVTYAIDDARRTLLRASYGMFGSQLASTAGSTLSGASYAWQYYQVTGVPVGQGATAADIRAGTLLVWAGHEPTNPTATTTFNRVDPDLKDPKTHEVILGVDRELARNLGFSGSYSYRRYVDMVWSPLPRTGIRSIHYQQTGTLTGTLPTGESYSVPFYGLIPGTPVAPGAGTELATREGYHQTFHGFEMQVTKRMADRWFGRFGFSTNSHREFFTNPETAIMDPTPTLTASAANPNKHGGLVVRTTSGSGKSAIYMVPPRYQFIANGMYQGPWGVNLGLNWVLRQGFGRLYNNSGTNTFDPISAAKTVLLVDDVGANRLPALSNLDVRVGKAFNVARANINVDLDIFNVTNAATVLGREYSVNLATADRVREIMQPRILRLGFRLGW
jgi:hypothetical protein